MSFCPVKNKRRLNSWKISVSQLEKRWKSFDNSWMIRLWNWWSVQKRLWIIMKSITAINEPDGNGEVPVARSVLWYMYFGMRLCWRIIRGWNEHNTHAHTVAHEFQNGIQSSIFDHHQSQMKRFIKTTILFARWAWAGLADHVKISNQTFSHCFKWRKWTAGSSQCCYSPFSIQRPSPLISMTALPSLHANLHLNCDVHSIFFIQHVVSLKTFV